MCRSEREALETSLYELQQQINQIESRREQLESENQNLRLRTDSMTGTREKHLDEMGQDGYLRDVHSADSFISRTITTANDRE